MMVARSRFGPSMLVAGCLSLLTAAPVSGQWLWKDDSGHTVASDQPPPTSVPPSRILKEPRKRASAQVAVPTDKDAPMKEPSRSDAPKSLADRELDDRQRQKEAADVAKKTDDDAARARAMQENCGAVKGNLAALQAGGRAARFNEKGERYYLDDAQRAGEISKAQGQIAQYCK